MWRKTEIGVDLWVGFGSQCVFEQSFSIAKIEQL